MLDNLGYRYEVAHNGQEAIDKYSLILLDVQMPLMDGCEAARQPEAFIQAKDELFDKEGNIGAASKEFLQTWMDRYVAWIKKHAI